ncbi:tRNA-intron lyase [Halocalculus aciditolerans]|nr:tRNA-intron lyase [Halocalculus aciditolerans]
MHGERRDGEIHVGGDARQRFHDSRGYGRPLQGNEIALAPVEAAHLLFRGDLDAVDGDGFREFVERGGDGFAARFFVYADLRDRGFYLSPAALDWDVVPDTGDRTDFVVYERGTGPRDGDVAHEIRVVGERTPVAVDSLGESVLAVVDEESEITYLDSDSVTPDGDTDYEPDAALTGVLLDDRVMVWNPPEALYESGFYGQPLSGRSTEHDALHLSLVEAAYLAARGTLTLENDEDADGSVAVEEGSADAGVNAVVSRGRAVEGDRFDRRLRAYRALRDAGTVPKTGFKFGADFRVYQTVDSVENLGHSTWLVRALQRDHAFEPRDLALDVRLAHGVRKTMVFAREDHERDTTDWVAVTRLTP